MTVDLDRLSPAKRALLERRLKGLPARDRVAVIPRREGDGGAPASYGQRQLWYLAELASSSTVYNEAVTIHCPGDADPASLERAFNEVLRRHEVWRTRLRLEGADLIQEVEPHRDHRLPIVDLRHLDPQRQLAEAARLATEDARLPFDRSGRQWRATLHRLTGEYRLHLTLRHIIFDGVSVYRVLLPELIALHDAFRAGLPSPLPEPSVQYSDYAAWQRSRVEGGELRAQLDHWVETLRDLPTLRLPTDHPRRRVDSFDGRFHPLALSGGLTEEMRELGRQSRATLFMTALAGFVCYLERLTGQRDLPIGTVSSGRRHPEVQGLLGYFLNSLVLRCDLSGDPSFREVVARVRDATLAGLANDEIPFEQVVGALRPERRPGLNPLFQVGFSLEPPLPDPPAGWDLTQMDVETGTAKVDLYVELDERPQGLIGRFVYRTDLFEPSTIERMVGEYREALAGLLAEPDRPISQLALPGAPEPAVMRGPEPAIPEGGIAARFERMVDAGPDREAVRAGGLSLTYRELDEGANRLARALRARGVGPGSLVGLCLERSPEMIVSLLAILKAGGAYLPLDPAYPVRRLERLLEIGGPRLVLTRRRHLAQLPCGVDALCVEDAGESGAEERVEGRGGSSDLAYVLFTSGSTGEPKGVMIEQRSVLRLVCPATFAEFGPEESVLQLVPLAFDVSALEIWGALLNGARLVLTPPGLLSARDLGELIEREGVTAICISTGHLSRLVEAGMPGMGGLRQIMTGGEAASVPHSRRLLELIPGVRLLNCYGPTEAATVATWHRVTAEDLDAGSIPIGVPIGNTTIRLLDDEGRALPPGVEGEIAIGGPGVARGYLGRDDLTRARFLPAPAGEEGRLYRTGDVGRLRPDGQLEFLGRRDRQLKVRGFRIEPDEIEAALRAHPAVSDAAVEAPEVEGMGRRLVAYVLSSAAPAELAAFVADTLPPHMVPQDFVPLDAFPINANGKVDRAALPAPPRPVPDGEATSPRGAVETEVAAIWAELIGGAPPPLEEDFFRLGGHSLLALRMVAEVERRLGRSVPLEVVFGAGSTVRGLARLIEEPEAAVDPPAAGLVVPLRAGGSRPPLFIVAPNRQSVPALRHILGHLEADQPLIALLPPTDQGRFDREAGVARLAAPLLERVRTIRPHGPYLLAGYSLGGLFAYELAARLVAAGEEVSLLTLVDTMAPRLAVRYGELTMDMRTRLRRLRLTPVWHWPPMLRGALLRIAGRVTDEASAAESADFDWEGAFVLATAYCPPPSELPLRVIASRFQRRWTRDPSLGWRGVHGGAVDTDWVPGDHRSMLLEPQVGRLAALVASGVRTA